MDATQGALIRALDGPKDAFVKRWLEERGPLSTKDPSIADPQIWTRGASDRSKTIVWGTVLDGKDGIVWQAPNTEEAHQTLALLERLGGRLRLSAGWEALGGARGTYGVIDPRARPKKGIVGSLMSMWRSGDDDEASAVIDDDDDDPALARKVEHWVKLFRIVRAVPHLMIACDRWRAGRAKRRAARREKKKALPTLPPKPLKAPGGRDYVAKREVTFVVPAHNVLEARAVEGAAHKLSSFMAGVRAAARDGQPLGAWLPRTRALLRADWLELACSGLDRGDAALLDAIADLRVVDDPVPLDVDGLVRNTAAAALGNTDGGMRAVRDTLRKAREKLKEAQEGHRGR